MMTKQEISKSSQLLLLIIIIIADSEDFASGGSERGDISMQFVTSDSTFCNS